MTLLLHELGTEGWDDPSHPSFPWHWNGRVAHAPSKNEWMASKAWLPRPWMVVWRRVSMGSGPAGWCPELLYLLLLVKGGNLLQDVVGIPSPVERCFRDRGIQAHVHEEKEGTQAIHFQLQTRMKGIGDGAGWEKESVTAAFEFTLSTPTKKRQTTSRRGLYLDQQVLGRALEGKKPEASSLKLHMSRSTKRVVADERDLKTLQRILPKVIPANALGPSERLHDTCAVVGSSSRMLDCKFGKDIDQHDAVFRLNDSPTKKFKRWVGSKTTYRLLNDVSKRGVDNATVLIPMHILHADVQSMKREGRIFWFVLHTPVPYVNLHHTYQYNGTTLPIRHTSSGVVALRLAMDLCNKTTAYGFTTEEEFTYGHYYNRKSKKPEPEFFKDKGHGLLTNRALFLFYNCSELVKFPKC